MEYLNERKLIYNATFIWIEIDLQRVVVIQTAFPGDVILCTPIFESLKSAGHETVGVFRPEAESLVRNNPNIDQTIYYDKRKGLPAFMKALYQLGKLECDISLSVQRYLKSAILPLYAGIQRRVGYDIAEVVTLYTHEIAYDKNKHEVERCLALCEGISPTSGFAPKIFITESELLGAQDMLKSHKVNPENFIAVAPGSIWATKRWVGYRELTEIINDELKCDIVLLGSSNDKELCREIASGGNAVNFAGETSLIQSAAIIKLAKFAVTNDSAPAHIAAAVGTPVVAIFGPTVPAFGFAPYTDKSVVVGIEDLYCRPCSKHGPMKCPEGHFRCMKEISPQRVFRACVRLLK